MGALLFNSAPTLIRKGLYRAAAISASRAAASPV